MEIDCMHMRVFTRLCVVIAVFFAFRAQSQTRLSIPENTPVFDLAGCIDYALEHNVMMRQSRLAIESSLVRLNQAKADVLPQVNGSVNGNSNFGRNVDPFSNSIVTQAIGTNSMGVGGSVIVYNGDRLKNTISMNMLDVEASQMDLQAQRNAISLQVALSYLNMLSTSEMIEVASRNLEITRLQLERTEKMVRAGSLPETNLFDLNAQIANDELQLVNAQNNYENAMVSLKQAMNYTGFEPIRVSEVNVPDPALQPYAESTQQVYDAAMSFLPEIKASRLREELAIKNIQIARSVGLPTIRANANWGTAYSTVAKRIIQGQPTIQKIPLTATINGETVPVVIDFPQTSTSTEGIPYFSQIGNNQNVNLGLNVQIPIFNGHARKYQEQAAKIQHMQSELTTESSQLTVRQNIDQAFINMSNAAKTYSASLIQVDALQKAFEAANARYNAGASNFVDYNLAKTNLDRASANLIQAKYDYVFRMKILDFYQNKPLQF
jgi:outer membrane protein